VLKNDATQLTVILLIAVPQQSRKQNRIPPYLMVSVRKRLEKRGNVERIASFTVSPRCAPIPSSAQHVQCSQDLLMVFF
jgi:hypothetical protein